MLPIKMHRCPITNLEIVNQEVKYNDDPTEAAYYYRVKYKNNEYYLGLCWDFYNLLINPKDKDTETLKELYQKLPLMFVELSKVDFEPFFNSRLHWDCSKVNSSRHKQFYIKSYVDDLILNNHTIPSDEEKLSLLLKNLRSLEKYRGDVIDVSNSFDLWTKCYLANEREFKAFLIELKAQNKLEYDRGKVRLRLENKIENKPEEIINENLKQPTFFERYIKPIWFVPAVMMLAGVFIFTPLRDKIFSSGDKNLTSNSTVENKPSDNKSQLAKVKSSNSDNRTNDKRDQKVRTRFYDYNTMLKDVILFDLTEHNKNKIFKDFHLISESSSNSNELQKEVNYSFQNKFYPEEKYNFFFKSSIENFNYVIDLNDQEVYTISILDTIQETEFNTKLNNILASEIDIVINVITKDSIK